jgi:hypothetical protein
MDTSLLLYNHIGTLRNPVVKFGSHPLYDSINLSTLCADCIRFNNITDWLKGKNVPAHLRKDIVLALLGTEPPDEVRAELLMNVL